MKKHVFKILGIVAVMGLMGYNLYISQPETKLFSNLTLDEMVSSAEAFEEGGGGSICSTTAVPFITFSNGCHFTDWTLTCNPGEIGGCDVGTLQQRLCEGEEYATTVCDETSPGDCQG